MDLIKVKVANAQGTGYLQDHECRAGTTIDSFLSGVAGCDADPERFTILVNRQMPVEGPDYVLQEGDLVSVSPKNVKGA